MVLTPGGSTSETNGPGGSNDGSNDGFNLGGLALGAAGILGAGAFGAAAPIMAAFGVGSMLKSSGLLPALEDIFGGMSDLFGGIFIIPIVFVLFSIYNISYILYNNITENREECKALIFASFYSLFMGLIIFILEKFIYFTMTIYKKKLTCDSSKNDSICSWNIPPHNDFYHNGVLGYHIPVFIVSLLFADDDSENFSSGCSQM